LDDLLLRYFSSGSSIIESVLFRALNTKFGIVVRSRSPDTFINKLYRVRSTNPIFSIISVVKRDPDIWLLKTKEPPDAKRTD
jgi:hypothetical protein